MNYCVITADVRGSRQLNDRAALQLQIEQTLAQINQKFAKVVKVPFQITIGDEWQGVTENLAHSYEIAVQFVEKMHPHVLAVGIGEGAIATEWRTRSADMDGDVFLRSRQALDQSKKKNQEIVFSTTDKHRDMIVNAVSLLLQTLRRHWTERQHQKVILYKEHRNEQKVANILGVSQADIHQALVAAEAKIYLDCEQKLNDFLRLIYKHNNL
ncbi:hypothetical protein DRQ15_02225 [candidate division KSB1 bacterium]|nr:hypothetical protein [bacterium]OQX60360.1 MAG: hypothetical protein B5M50_01185 [candidate division KSB1 bacterium 4484_219]RKY84708.1 MAG: hypothetical protein DRP98_04340 [candidate division KSB1 bacterium]RKY88857.1 MAG: hypothetical protein DRQ11_02520 [candidate division KSB1 bacterium]RKY92476.1 MAG: hypothetical protein DRQ15_02225 [candidate division KSB1 bacterium]